MNGRLYQAAAAIGSIALARAILRRRHWFELHDRVALITGGSRGLGLVLARELVAEGAKVAICARDADELARAESELVSRDARVLALTCDITRRDAVGTLVSRVRDELGPIDVLINNAGVIDVGPVEHMTVEDFDRAMATHFWGPLHLTLAVLPEMRERGGGRIANITSLGGKLAVPHMLPYTASKFALVGLSEGLRAELVAHDIRVTTVVPGLMRTGSPVNASFKGQYRKEYAWFAIADSLPFTSMRAERAARRIVDAIRFGDPEVVLSAQAWLAVKLHALFPNAVQGALGLANRLLPAPGGIGSGYATGRESFSRAVPSVLTRASDRAALRNNEG